MNYGLAFKTCTRRTAPENLNCTKTAIFRKNGTYFRTCIFKSKNADENAVGILWLHGGGYVMGAPEMAVMTLPKAPKPLMRFQKSTAT